MVFVYWILRAFASNGYSHILLSIILVPFSLFVGVGAILALPDSFPNWLNGTIALSVVVAVIAVAVAPIIVRGLGTQLTGPLPQQFRRLGSMQGMSSDDVIAKIGPANSRTAMADGTLLQWISNGYHIAIMFDSNGKFTSIQHEHMA